MLPEQKLLEMFTSSYSPVKITELDYTADDFLKIVVPTLILLGDRDGIVELQQAVDEYQLIPHAELCIIPNATHFTAESELSMGIVLAFFQRNRS